MATHMMSSVPTEASESGLLVDLTRRLDGQTDFAEAVAHLAAGNATHFERVWGSVRALLASALCERCERSLVVVLPHAADIDSFAAETALFTEAPCVTFPAVEHDRDNEVVRDELFGDRLRVLKALAGQQPPPLIATSVQAVMQMVPAAETMVQVTRRLAVGEEYDLRELLDWLVAGGFHNTSEVALPGEFSSRGGILDVFAPDWDQPVRIEMFGDVIESLRGFDIATQRSTADIAEIDITLPGSGEQNDASLADHLPAGSWLLLVEPPELAEEARHYLERSDQTSDLLSYAGLMQGFARFPLATCESVAASPDEATCRLPFGEIERFSGDIGRVRDELDQAAAGKQVTIVCRTEAEIKRLGEIFNSTQTGKENRLGFLLGRLSAGFCYLPEDLVVVGGDQLFQRVEIARPTRRHMGKAIDSFLELRSGDLVVHLAHGIGRYRGIDLLEKGDTAQEHLKIEFHGGTTIYVPATKISLVQKYVGGTKSRPRLAKIGGKNWVKQKRAAEAAVEDLAVEMLEIQAARASRPGIGFPPDSAWQSEFDAAFPYQETDDQQAAITAIKGDMVRGQPMDRLLCGDVGYGKTEVAMRAAFKAVDAGYQVGMLVPTTILVQQHLQSFRNRMAEFPFRIAALSRFSTAKEQGELLEELAAGRIDIVIGTHRLAQKDVFFDNLGLIIIDEEQRFGVEIKERLKHIRKQVDVLTLTATPIPRTLHLSLMGVRDISNLETPPEDRTAVDTRVTRFNEELIRHAVLRELGRDGQIFFVHNRVQDIGLVAAKLQRIVPEARLAIGHGQMPEGQLARVMVDFVEHKFDLLLATTIVESGLDIPNANTIFIDEADRYGLADLHQLRGRVGRYKHHAYCYLLLDEKKQLSPVAAKRLRAIEEFSDMGAGFAIAMRDLEIRGAGNILGTQQSGHIAAVGYEFYCELLEQAVRRLRNEPPKTVIDVDIDIPGEAYLPRSYIPDMKAKLDLYRRLARIASDEQLADLGSEMHDRFGAVPAPVERLLALAELRVHAAAWSIRSIHLDDDGLVFGFGNRRQMSEMIEKQGGGVRIVDGHSAVLPLRKQGRTSAALLERLQALLLPQ
ncbi:MAG: transcription-repair coupling factor [Planctomycetota bacterium]|nr:MAG: transcription-repair coupling factor [Planctomycetota bacterium]REJ95671.1 MAG: transcription-repair coupling factor [Planctomycetota bacterium]